MTIEAEHPITIDDLTITLHARGHRMTTGGDRNLAEIILQTPNTPVRTELISGDGNGNVNKTLLFDDYTVTLEKIHWDGLSLTLSIAKNNHTLGGSLSSDTHPELTIT